VIYIDRVGQVYDAAIALPAEDLVARGDQSDTREFALRQLVERVGDRLLSLVVPRTTAAAACEYKEWCSPTCSFGGPLRQYRVRNENCHTVYYGCGSC
jgi:hypothetical protein